jgi:hypothetical protein
MTYFSLVLAIAVLLVAAGIGLGAWAGLPPPDDLDRHTDDALRLFDDNDEHRRGEL